MRRTFLLDHTGPYLIFGDSIWPTHSKVREHYIARPTASGGESRLGLLDPIPIADIERNDMFSKSGENRQYLESLIMSDELPMDADDYMDRVNTLALIVGEVFPLLAEDPQGLTPKDAIDEIIASNPSQEKKEPQAIIQSPDQSQDIPPFIENLPEAGLANLSYPQAGFFPPKQSSILARCLNFNSFYVSDNYARMLRQKKPTRRSDRIHIHGQDLYWTRRFRLDWIEEVYQKMINRSLADDLNTRIRDVEQAKAAVSSDKTPYSRLVQLPEFSFRNLVVRWMGSLCYLTMKRGPFLRQDAEHPTRWHKRGEFEIGGAFYYSRGRLLFSETPVVRADYPDIAFFSGATGTFRRLCSTDRDQWSRFPRTAEGIAQYVRSALDLYYNGFNPDNIRNHVGPFGDGATYRELCPLDKAVTAHSLEEVKAHGTPANYHLPLEG